MKNTRFVKLATTILAGILAWNTKYCGAACSDDGTNPPPEVVTNFRQGGDPLKGPAVLPTKQSPSIVALNRLKPGVILLGCHGGGCGTGFVISRKQRLIATAAHVADHMIESGHRMVAVLHGTLLFYRVERAWYHPRITRKFDEGLYAFSDDPRDGEIADHVPDVAVIQLSADGPELPEELILARSDEFQPLEGRAATVIGYGDSAEKCWPVMSQPATATLAAAVLRRSTDDFERVDRPIEKRQWVWFESNVEDGMSGAPVFLQNGHVIAVVARKDSKRGIEAPLCDGYRVDCIRELLFYHGLLRGVGIHEKPLITAPDWRPDPHLDLYRKAAKYVRDADALRRAGDYLAASQRSNDAIEAVPSYASAYLQRSKVYLYYCGLNWNLLSHEKRLRYAEWAFQDSVKCIEILPEWGSPVLIYLESSIYLSRLNNDLDGFRRVIQTVDELLDEKLPHPRFSENEKGFAINCRAQCHHFLGDWTAAERDYNQSIRLDPSEPRWYINRAQFWESRGQPELAAKDRESARSLRVQRSEQSGN